MTIPFNAAPPRPDAPMRRLGFLGGSFDPVHNGHLALARAALEQLSLERLYFVPAGQAPLKDTVHAGAAHRWAMLRLAIAGEPRFDALDWEIETGGISYTIDTARRLRARWPYARLYWIVGADKLAELPKWKHIEKLAAILEFAWAQRAGAPTDCPAFIRRIPLRDVASPESSSCVRARCASGEAVDFLLPDSVNRYIKEHRLYTPKNDD